MQQDSKLFPVNVGFSPSNALENDKSVKMEAVSPQPDESLPAKNPKSEPVPCAERSDEDEDNIHYLSGERFFDLILTKSNVEPRISHLNIPTKFVPYLPRARVPAVLTSGGKNWNMTYMGDNERPRFDGSWKIFVKDNNLKDGDGCVFELMECSSEQVRFKVHILRGDLPPELQEVINSIGKTEDSPILIDD